MTRSVLFCFVVCCLGFLCCCFRGVYTLRLISPSVCLFFFFFFCLFSFVVVVVVVVVVLHFSMYIGILFT